ncbi:FKBP-type peptidyl-prolyl cis-trans isomerase [Cryomorphaceae bacterium 1068]|nr:FKBP-type peptidyl-prolyl cis-trans isomerase [Cryomorphaceae bacterium 1068]
MRIATLLILWTLLFAASCSDSKQGSQQRMPTQDELIEANKRKVGKEADLINQFIAQSGWEMKETKTGIRYDIYHLEDDTVNAKSGDVVSISYSLHLLDGTRVSDTNLSGPVIFKVGEGNVVSGLHEAVTLLSVGDSARLILPSYLGYGLTGDQNKIPSNAALFYDLSLVSLD